MDVYHDIIYEYGQTSRLIGNDSHITLQNLSNQNIWAASDPQNSYFQHDLVDIIMHEE